MTVNGRDGIPIFCFVGFGMRAADFITDLVFSFYSRTRIIQLEFLIPLDLLLSGIRPDK